MKQALLLVAVIMAAIVAMPLSAAKPVEITLVRWPYT